MFFSFFLKKKKKNFVNVQFIHTAVQPLLLL